MSHRCRELYVNVYEWGDLINYNTLHRDTSFRSDETLTASEDLGEDAALVGRVDLVRCLPLAVGAIQQAAIFGVAQKLLGDALTLGTETDV